FLPSPGVITGWQEPLGPGVRVDSGYTSGNRVTPRFDPLLAKLIVHGPTRPAALDLAGTALGEFQIEGPRTNLAFLSRLVEDPRFRSGDYDTGLVATMAAGTAQKATV